MSVERIKNMGPEKVKSGTLPTLPKQNCNVLVVDKDERFKVLISNALKRFSFDGKSPNILFAITLQEATELISRTDEIIVVIFNKIHFENKESDGFLNVLKKYVRGKNGEVFIRNLDNSQGTPQKLENPEADYKNNPELSNQRKRLGELIEMAIITYDSNVFDKLQPEKSNTADSGNVGNRFSAGDTDRLKIDSNEKDNLGDYIYELFANGLKGPIGNIKVLMDVLTNEPELLDEKTSNKLLSSVKNSAHSMNEILDSFLFWTRVRRNQLNFTPIRIDIENLIMENIELLKGSAQQKGLSIDYQIYNNEIEVVGFADEVMVTAVLKNLVNNAIKFTERGGGKILITAATKNGYVEISVKDNGIGMEQQVVSGLFDPKKHISTKGTENETGSGLGLLLCKDYVEKNGGTLTVKSKPGEGSTFTFTIPAWSNTPGTSVN